MKQITTVVGILLSALILMSCANGRYPYPKSDLGEETWRAQVETHSSAWAMKADDWFLDGGPSRAKIENDRAGYNAAISRNSVRVTNFIGIRAIGDFQVQITGDPDRNTLTIEGPNDAVRAVIVKMNNNVLCLEQADDAPANMGQVIVHINMRHLESLEHNGLGSVEGVRLDSNHLRVENTGCGNIFLAGRMDVKSIISHGPGTVNVFTICSNDTEIVTTDTGNVNLAARRYVTLRSIKHKGSGDINVIGAVDGNLRVSAEGKGKIGVYGRVNIREIKASGKTCVFIASSDSPAPCIYVYDDARVGIDGNAGSLNGYTTRTARLLTRYLHTQNSYVQASGVSHMNVTAYDKIFATANDYATIYFYGDPNIMTAFKRGRGVVVNMGTPSSPEEVIVSREPSRRVSRAARHHRMPSGEPNIKIGQNDLVGPPKFVWRKGRLVEVSDNHMYV